jgi:3-hydroxyisobutyrate dehydrogenase
MEMSTTDADEVLRLGAIGRGGGRPGRGMPRLGRLPPGGYRQHLDLRGRSARGGGSCPAASEAPGRRILHTGPLGSASKLKVMTNYLATVNLVSLCEAMTVMKAAGLDLATTYEAIRISSGTSFVHETESQLILSGSRDVNFTMDLVQKDIGLFQKLADDNRRAAGGLAASDRDHVRRAAPLWRTRTVGPDHRTAGGGDRPEHPGRWISRRSCR